LENSFLSFKPIKDNTAVGRGDEDNELMKYYMHGIRAWFGISISLIPYPWVFNAIRAG